MEINLKVDILKIHIAKNLKMQYLFLLFYLFIKLVFPINETITLFNN